MCEMPTGYAKTYTTAYPMSETTTSRPVRIGDTEFDFGSIGGDSRRNREALLVREQLRNEGVEADSGRVDVWRGQRRADPTARDGMAGGSDRVRHTWPSRHSSHPHGKRC